MTWLALADHSERRLSLRGLGSDKKDVPLLKDTPSSLLTRGTILIETHLPVDEQPKVLFSYKKAGPILRSLTIQTTPNNGIGLVQVQGTSITHAALPLKPSDHTDVLRLTYSWDTVANWARLSVEQPERASVTSTTVGAPQSISLDDARDLMLGRGDHTMVPELIFAALSDQIEPIGPMATLAHDTPLATPWGYKPLASLQRGDTVVTRDAGVVPVLHKLSRMVPARGSFAPVRLRAPYFGLVHDIVVSAEQRLLIDGPDVEYIFGKESVLIPAHHLVNDFTALFEPCGPTVQYSQVLLPGHDAVLAAGLPLESLYIGRLRRDKARLQGSILHHLDRSTLPDHAPSTRHVLKRFEALQLAHQRAA